MVILYISDEMDIRAVRQCVFELDEYVATRRELLGYDAVIAVAVDVFIVVAIRNVLAEQVPFDSLDIVLGQSERQQFKFVQKRLVPQ